MLPTVTVTVTMTMTMTMTMTVIVIVIVIMIVRAGRKHDQRTIQIGGDRSIWIGFRGDHAHDALMGEPMAQAMAHATGDQHLHLVQRVRRVRRAVMEGLFLGQFEQLLANDLVLLGFIDPEIPASAGVFHDRAPILAGDCDFHLDFS